MRALSDGAFVSKLYQPEAAEPGNFDLSLLTLLAGVAFATALVGFIVSVTVPATYAGK